MTVLDKLSKIQLEFKAPKDKYNSFGKYNYRSAESILEAIKPLLQKYNASIVIEESVEEINNHPVIRSKASLYECEEGKSISAVAYAGVEKAGGMALPQAYGSASSYAKKYALGNLLLIDDTQDADSTNTHTKPQPQAKPKMTAAQFASTVKKIREGLPLEEVQKHFSLSQEEKSKLIEQANKPV